jgi:hypothetical protein
MSSLDKGRSGGQDRRNRAERQEEVAEFLRALKLQEPPAVDVETLRKLVRQELSRKESLHIRGLCLHFRSWAQARLQVLREEFPSEE